MRDMFIAAIALLLASVASASAIQLGWAEDLSAPNDATYQFTDVQVIGGDVYMSGSVSYTPLTLPTNRTE